MDIMWIAYAIFVSVQNFVTLINNGFAVSTDATYIALAIVMAATHIMQNNRKRY